MLKVTRAYGENKYAKIINSIFERRDSSKIILSTASTWLWWISTHQPFLRIVGRKAVEYLQIKHSFTTVSRNYDFVEKNDFSDQFAIPPCESAYCRLYEVARKQVAADTSMCAMGSKDVGTSCDNKCNKDTLTIILSMIQHIDDQEMASIDADICVGINDMRKKLLNEWNHYLNLNLPDDAKITPNSNYIESVFAHLKRAELNDFTSSNEVIRNKATVKGSGTSSWFFSLIPKIQYQYYWDSYRRIRQTKEEAQKCLISDREKFWPKPKRCRREADDICWKHDPSSNITTKPTESTETSVTTSNITTKPTESTETSVTTTVQTNPEEECKTVSLTDAIEDIMSNVECDFGEALNALGAGFAGALVSALSKQFRKFFKNQYFVLFVFGLGYLFGFLDGYSKASLKGAIFDIGNPSDVCPGLPFF